MIKKLIHKLIDKHQDSMSFKEAMDLAELPIVTFMQGKQKINFLLDTGSNQCIIDSNFLKKIKHTMLNMETSLYGLEGNVQKPKICMITMSYKDRNYEYPYLVQDMSAAFGAIKKETGVTVNGMLGSKFFSEFKYVLDFDELIAYSKQTNKKE